ncbi:hypothetical protein FHS18_005767 [Paenibacillus phyllosphaerae]|uniref:Uncharacterized protein n=1 Tax=Paenibacillus phyllosphaerae TaxID=274593 RepID=A0A7W5FR40_9BACL|nr:hypothetical protein [Paenibacillus phyllosphaerae]MBB3113654.1 hypothetical protein [Paenibacillus phyllosphaerae]
MVWIVLAANMIGAAFIYLLRRLGGIWRKIADGAASLALLAAASIAGSKVIEIIVNDEVLMTTVHEIFLNEIFLISSAYLGAYFIERLFQLTIEGERE